MKSYIYVGLLTDITDPTGYELAIVQVRANNEQEAHDIGRLRFDPASPLVKFAVVEVEKIKKDADAHEKKMKGNRG